MFRYLVLGLLRDGKPRHGYALMKEYRERSGIQLSTGNFYRELQKLAGEGRVRAVAKAEGADARQVPYEITPEGLLAFDQWLRAPARPRPVDYEDELSCRTLFISETEPAVARDILERWQEALWISGKMLERAREAVMMRPEEHQDSGGALALLLARRLKHVAADLEFLEELHSAHDQRTDAADKPPESSARASRGRRAR